MKTFIKNRDGKLAFVMHGLGGNKNQGHIRAMAEAIAQTLSRFRQ